MTPEFATALEHHQNGRLQEAEQGYRAVLEAEPEHAAALHYLGLIALQCGHPDEAAGLLQQSLALDPADAEAHEHFGLALTALGQPGLAERHLREAIRLDPSAVGAPQNLCIALMEQGRWSEAEPLARSVLDRSPDEPGALNNLGLCQLHQGQRDDAAATFRHAIAIHPGLIEAYSGLAEAQDTHATDPLLLQLDLLSNSEMPEAARVLCHFALGRMHDDAGNLERAFEHYGRANAARALTTGAFDLAAHEQRIDLIRGAFGADFFGGSPHAERLPVFVVGMPRSGTSLVEQILAAHPSVHGAHELPWMGQIANELMRAECAPDVVAQMREEYLAALRTLAPTAERIVDKMPHNFEVLWAITLLFPEATIIHVARDPRDVALSCWTQNFRQPHPWKHDLTTLGGYLLAAERLMDHWRAVLPRPPVEVGYEALVAEPEAHARQLIDAIGLPWHDDVARFWEIERPVRTPSALAVRQPPHPGRVGRWRRFEPWLSPLLSYWPDL